MRALHSRFQTPIGYKNFFWPVLYFCSFFPSSSLFYLHIVILFTPQRQLNGRTNERANERLNGNSSLLMACSSFAYHDKLFAFCLAPLSFGTRSAPTMTTTMKTTTMLMPTPPLLYVAQKGPFKIFKCKKHGETLEFFLGALPSM
jgi:hypothetical protein